MLDQIRDRINHIFYENYPYREHGSGIFATRYPSEMAWKNVTQTAAAVATSVVNVGADQAIVISDLIWFSDKKNGGTATLYFNDGTNTENILNIGVNDGAYALHAPFAGHMQGWIGADIKLTTVTDYYATVTVLYQKIPKSKAMTYDQFTGLR